MKRIAILAAAVLASPASAAIECSKAVQTAAFKRAVASSCGYFVNDGDLEQRAHACAARIMTAEAVRLAEFTGSSVFGGMRNDMGLQKACRTVLKDMRGGFVAD